MAFFLGYSVDPALLADGVATTLEGRLVAGTNVANKLLKYAQGFVPPGVAGEVHVPYKYILFLLGAVARVDGSAALGAANPLRGTWDPAWIDAALQNLDLLGAFASPSASLEDVVETCVTTASAQPIYPPALIFTAADYMQNLNWFPGHFGAMLLQPWHCGLTFSQHASGPTVSLRPLFLFVYECSPHYVRSQVIDASGGFVLMGKAYLRQMEKYSELEEGTMGKPLALSTLCEFSSTVSLPKAMWILPHDTSALLRLFAQRCALANAGMAGGSTSAAEEALLRQHFLRYVWRLPQAAILLDGVASPAEGYACLERIYNALPPERRSSTAKPMARLVAANAALNADKVATEVARTSDVESRVQELVTFVQDVSTGIAAARRADGALAGGGTDPLDVSISHAGGDPLASSTEAALGKFSSLRADISAALLAKDFPLAWAHAASGDQLLLQQILFNVSKVHSADSTLKALYMQRGELPLYIGAELIDSLKTENPGMITAENSMLLDGFRLDSSAFSKLILLNLHEIDMFSVTVQALNDCLHGYPHVPQDNWHVGLIDSDKMQQQSKGGHRLLRAVGFKDSQAGQTADELTYDGFIKELISAISRGSMIQAEDARLAHYEQIIDCYIDVLKYCGERAASLLRANPDQEALGYFIPSVLGCGPLMKMRGLHQHAAQDRNRRSASAPSSSSASAPKEQPVALVRRRSEKYGDVWYGAPGKHSRPDGPDATGGKQPKLSEYDPATVGTMPHLTWDSEDGTVIFAGKDAWYKSTLVEHLGDYKCLPAMVSLLGANACRCPGEHGYSHVASWHVKPTKRLEPALDAAWVPWANRPKAAAAGTGDAAAADGGAGSSSVVVAPSADGAGGGGKGKGGGKGQGGRGKGQGKGKGGGGKGKGKGKGGKGRGGKGRGGGQAFW